MTAIVAIDPAHASPKSAELLAGVKRMLGATPNMFRVAAHAPSVLESMAAQFAAAAHGSLNARAREAIALTVAESNGCDYCLSAHSVFAKGAGLSAEDQLKARQGSAADPKLAALVGLAQALVEGRGRVPASTLAAARAAGISDAELLEVVANVALNVFTNYFNLLAGTEIDFPLVEHLPEAH